MARLTSGGLRRAKLELQQEDGTSMIEMALVLPVFTLMVLGFIQFALIMYGMGNANFAGRSALRYATLHSSTSYAPATQADFNKIASNFIFHYPSNTYTITPTYNLSNTVGSGVCIAVSVTYSFTALHFISRPISYSSTGCGVIQQ